VKLKQAEMEEEILKGLIYFVYVPSSPGRALGKKNTSEGYLEHVVVVYECTKKAVEQW